MVPALVLGFTITYYVKNRANGLSTEDLLLVNPITYLVVILVAIVIIRELVGFSESRKGKEPKTVNPQESDSKSARKVIIYSALVTAYLLSINYLGAILSTFLFAVTGMYMLGVRRIKIMVLLGIGTSLFIFVSFSYLLQVPLPQGIFIDPVKAFVSFF